MTEIRKLHDDGKVTPEGIYSIGAKQALVCYIEQTLHNNTSWWTCPETLPGMTESTAKAGVWYYIDGDSVYGAWEK